MKKIGSEASRNFEQKPKSHRRNFMKSNSKDNAEGKMHQVKGKNNDTAGNRDLKTEGKDGNPDGKVQEKFSQVEIDVSSVHEKALVARPVAGPLMLTTPIMADTITGSANISSHLRKHLFEMMTIEPRS
ncbi:MAG: CsbD family protein [Deltaproteobacteria bacterium]|nr:CsbD family protein [Deltaproteobacteria bacterium]